jgi:transcriptional regulator NrdR family protein
MQIIKRNGEKQDFDFQKIKNALDKAFQSVYHDDAPVEIIDYLQATMPLKEDMTVEDIQVVVEDVLMQFG